MGRSRVSILLLATTLILGVSGCGELDLGRETAAGSSPSPAIPPGAVKYRAMLMQAWQYYFNLDQDPAIGFSQVHQESRFDCSAVSPGGSLGCAQFTTATAERIHKLIPPEVRATCPKRSGCPTDPRWAFTAMVQYDWELWSGAKWAAGARERWGFTLASYNGGPGWASGSERKACEKTRGCNPSRYFDHVERMCGATGRSAASCAENRQYPRIILDHWGPVYRRWLGS